MKKIKVLIVEDQMLIRTGLKFHLNEIEEVEVLGEATNGQEFLDFIINQMPDVVLMDINMPVMNGIEATRLAMQKYPDLTVLVLSSYDDEENLGKMMAEGIRGYLLKNVNKEVLKEAILKVADGKFYFSPEILPLLTNELVKKESQTDGKEKLNKLTAREVEILKYICQGFTNIEIGKKCAISERTAGGHRFNILKKTGCRNTIGLMFFAIKNGFLKE
jgi:DNA-binding NarL/FixJ family response regulator